MTRRYLALDLPVCADPAACKVAAFPYRGRQRAAAGIHSIVRPSAVEGAAGQASERAELTLVCHVHVRAIVHCLLPISRGNESSDVQVIVVELLEHAQLRIIRCGRGAFEHSCRRQKLIEVCRQRVRRIEIARRRRTDRRDSADCGHGKRAPLQTAHTRALRVRRATDFPHPASSSSVVSSAKPAVSCASARAVALHFDFAAANLTDVGACCVETSLTRVRAQRIFHARV